MQLLNLFHVLYTDTVEKDTLFTLEHGFTLLLECLKSLEPIFSM